MTMPELLMLNPSGPSAAVFMLPHICILNVGELSKETKAVHVSVGRQPTDAKYWSLPPCQPSAALQVGETHDPGLAPTWSILPTTRSCVPGLFRFTMLAARLAAPRPRHAPKQMAGS